MSLAARTPEGLTLDLLRESGHRLRCAVRDAGSSLAILAASVGRDPSIAEDWASGRKPFPVYVLAHPRVPRAIRAQVLSWLAETLVAETSALTVEAATLAVLQVAGEIVSCGASSLFDGRVDGAERAALRPLMARLHRIAGAWLAQHGGEERAS